MQFLKLRLAGFKSFADPTELVIEPGLTGVVGPNGCGKSNLTEALRWVMGENSAKAMRGGEMDDVIFSGSGGRARRNVAEVTITLDNSDRRAPAGFNDSDEIVISRRIERGRGSQYRINGRVARARDVQMLFADASSGARSPAIVGQGRIGTLVNARPSDRRAILEDAAGIGGLYARRHEAELRLRAAETNLTRLDDVIAGLETQMQSLKRQARQARQYRRLSNEIRQVEALLFLLRWQAVEDRARQAAAELDAAGRAVAEAEQAAREAAHARARAEAALPPARCAGKRGIGPA